MKKLLFTLVILTLFITAAVPVLAGEVSLVKRARGWEELFPPVSPPSRSDHAMTYDTRQGVAVLFGGAGESSALDDTWEWDSATMTWVERQPAHRPPARFGHAMAYDEARRVTVLFGGTSWNLDDYGDTWLWDGDDWIQVYPSVSPAPRWLAAMAYDAQRQVIVLFGGNGDGIYGDTWEWKYGRDWIELDIVGPSPRYGHVMAYDPNRNVMVMFGGADLFRFYNDTFERVEGGAWQQSTPPRSPSPRARPGFVYLPPAGRNFLFGGSKFVYFDDSWAWNGRRWQTAQFDPRPPARCCFAMVYDPVLEGVLVFGGSLSWVKDNDTWLFR
ncbi:MAG: kelch repeat-containing protein [Chloroflexota bacterium]